ncbi:MAG: PAS domain-containing protein, partial [Myxococcales bacterium]
RDIDFERLFGRLPNPYMILDRQLRYVAANETYLQLTASRLEDLLGKHLFDLFPNDPADPANAPAAMLRASFERVLATGQTDELALIPYRVPIERDGRVVTEERLWSATHVPVLDAQGQVAFVLQHTVDVTELERLRRGEAGPASTQPTPSGALERLGAGVLGRAESVQDHNRRLDAERQRLHTLFEQAPGFICVLQGPGHEFVLANRSYRRLVGQRDLVGRTVGEALPEVSRQGFVQLLDRVYQSGEPFVGEGVRLDLQRTPGGPLEETFVDFIYQPVRGDDGVVTGIFVQGHDVTARQAAEREREQARQVAEAFSAELLAQSKAVKSTLDGALQRIHELEAELARRS